MDARAGVAVAFHLPTVRTIATDDQVRGMYFLSEDVQLESIEAIAMAPGGAAMLMKDGTFQLPPSCPVAQLDGISLLQSHAPELEVLGDLGFLCIGIGQIPGLPLVALALDFQDGWARGAAIFSSAPKGSGLELLAAIGVRILKTEALADGRVLVHLENRLEAHFDAARLSSYQRTGNCNRFFLTHGTATDGIEQGLMDGAAYTGPGQSPARRNLETAIRRGREAITTAARFPLRPDSLGDRSDPQQIVAGVVHSVLGDLDIPTLQDRQWFAEFAQFGDIGAMNTVTREEVLNVLDFAHAGINPESFTSNEKEIITSRVMNHLAFRHPEDFGLATAESFSSAVNEAFNSDLPLNADEIELSQDATSPQLLLRQVGYDGRGVVPEVPFGTATVSDLLEAHKKNKRPAYLSSITESEMRKRVQDGDVIIRMNPENALGHEV